jgi:hypothetical protein
MRGELRGPQLVEFDPTTACNFSCPECISADLPDHTCRGELASGRLVHVFPQWRTEDGIVHLVFTTRRGLPPVVRAFIDHLAGAFRNVAS